MHLKRVRRSRAATREFRSTRKNSPPIKSGETESRSTKADETGGEEVDEDAFFMWIDGQKGRYS